MSYELDSLVDALPSIAFTALSDGRLAYCNQMWSRYTGLSLSDSIGRDWRSVVHPDDLARVVEYWAALTPEANVDDLDDLIVRLSRTDGSYRRFLVRVSPMLNEKGQVGKWCGLFTDVEGLQSAAHMPCTDEMDVAAIIDSIPAMVAFMTPAGDLERVNRKINDYFRLPYEALKDWTTSGTIHTQDLAAVISAWAYSVNTGEPYDIEIRLRRFDGVYHWFHVSGLPIRDRNGRIIRWCVLQVDIDERKRDKALIAKAFREVSASEDRMRNIINAVPGLVWSATADGNVSFLNQRWCEYTGMSMGEARGNGWTTTVHPEDIRNLMQYWVSLLQAGRAGEFEARLRRFDGVYRWFLIRVVPQHDETGSVLSWFGENTDIEDRKQTEMLLAGEKQLFAMMASGSPLQTTLTRLCDLIEAMVDDCACSIAAVDSKRSRHSHDTALRATTIAFGNFPVELRALNDGTVSDAPPCPATMAIALKSSVILSDLRKENQWTVWRSAALSLGFRASWSIPFTSTGSDVSGVLSILLRSARHPSSDVQNLIAQFTHLASIAIERASGEAALKQSEAFLAKAQRLSATGTFSWRVDTNQIIWSDEIYRILELDTSVTPSLEHIIDRIHPGDLSTLKETVRLLRKAGRDFEQEHRLLMPDGKVKYVHLVAHAVRDASGGLEYIAAVQDVTQRRLSEETLNKVRSELTHLARVASLGAVTASIAHEVNQPLAGIITNASTCLRMLGADPPNVVGARETARRTIRDGNRAADVIKRLRALYSKKDIAVEEVDLNEAAGEVIAMISGEVQRKGILIDADFAEQLPSIKGDRVQLQQVILNLILNAAESMIMINTRSRRMLISTRLDDNADISFSVSDNGVGFDPQDLERLFSAFYTTKDAGMGIGLSISRSIIERHDGKLRATVNDGPGATFCFSIPKSIETSLSERDKDTDEPAASSGFNHTKGSLG